MTKMPSEYLEEALKKLNLELPAEELDKWKEMADRFQKEEVPGSPIVTMAAVVKYHFPFDPKNKHPSFLPLLKISNAFNCCDVAVRKRITLLKQWVMKCKNTQ